MEPMKRLKLIMSATRQGSGLTRRIWNSTGNCSHSAWAAIKALTPSAKAWAWAKSRGDVSRRSASPTSPRYFMPTMRWRLSRPTVERGMPESSRPARRAREQLGSASLGHGAEEDHLPEPSWPGRSPPRRRGHAHPRKRRGARRRRRDNVDLAVQSRHGERAVVGRERGMGPVILQAVVMKIGDQGAAGGGDGESGEKETTNRASHFFPPGFGF